MAVAVPLGFAGIAMAALNVKSESVNAAPDKKGFAYCK